MFRGQLHSLANPIQGSSFSTYGIKPGKRQIVFSVGTQVSAADDYITKNDDGDDVIFSINNGVLIFSHPQTHLYIGIGDVIKSAGTDVYLNTKIGPGIWTVTDESGNVPSDVVDVTLTSIDKTFPDLNSAIDSASSGAYGLLGTNDLVSLGAILGIACYEMTDTSANINVTGWTADAYNYVRLFTPYDIKTECNSRQRHLGIMGTGYVFDQTGFSGAINLSNSYTEVEGLCVDANPSVNTIAINVPTSSYLGCKIIHNIVKGGFYSNINSRGVAFVVGNISYDSPIGIRDLGDNGILINNTIVDCPTGIEGGTNTESWNNLIQGATTAGITGTTNINNTITNDATGDIPNETINFRDASSDDFHIDFHSKTATADPITGGDDTVTSLFLFDRDIDSELMAGNGWPIGADRFVPEPHFAIGKDTSDIKTGAPNVTITNGLMTFSLSQTDDTLCSGCLALVGGTDYYLYKKISDTEWWVTDGAGLAPSDIGSTAVTSIKYPFNSIHAAIDGDSSPGVSTPLGGLNLPSLGVRLTIACTEGSLYIGAEIDSGFVTDENHYIKIYTPNTPGTDCNVTRRHRGVFSYNYCLQNGIGNVNDALKITKDYSIIDGMQLSANGAAIRVSGCENTTIINNIAFSTKDDAVVFDDPNGGGFNIIANNIIYDSSKDGVKIVHNNSMSADSYYYIYNNTVYHCYDGISLDIDLEDDYRNIVTVYNNISQRCTNKDYSCTSGPSEYLISQANFGSDRSLDKFFGVNDQSSWTVSFKDSAYRDFHITLYESLRMINVLDLSADAHYPFSVDIDNESRNRYRWNAGADNWAPEDIREIHYSIGNESGNLDDVISRTITIQDNILTFEGGSVNPDIGVGDKVVYDGTLLDRECYLAERGNNNTWLVRSKSGELTVVDESSITIGYVSRVSNDLANAIDGTGSKSFENEYGSRNLTGGGISTLFGWCYYDDAVDVGNFTVQNWNTDEDHRLKILTPWNENTQVGASQRHSGLWGTTGFSIEPTGALCVDISNDYVTFEGIKAKAFGSNPAITINSGYSDCDIYCNIIKDATIGIRSLGAGGSNNVVANVVYDTTVSAIDVANGVVLNNTMVGTAGNGVVVTANTTIWNNIINGFPTCISGTPGSSRLNIVSDTSGTTNLGNKQNATINFVDSTGKDFHLRRDDILALNQGADLKENEFSPFNQDIDMTPIEDMWSIGAHVNPEFEDIDLYFSVSKNQDNLRESVSSTITISSGIATFNEAQTKDIGIGDRVIYDSGECYLYRKISQIVWEVRNKYGLNPDDVVDDAVTSIMHTFDEIGDAVYGSGSDGIREFLGDSNNPFFNFIAAQYRVHLPAYKYDLAYHTNKIVIKDYVTDEDHYLRVYAPYDIINECNERQRHEGYVPTPVGAQVLIDPSSTEAMIINSNYTSIDGVIAIPGTLINGIILDECFGSKITGNIVKSANNGIHNNNGQYVYDNFSSGSIGGDWDSEFDANWSLRDVSPDEKIAIADSTSWDRLTKDCQDDFDFEFGIYVDEQDSTETQSLKIQMNDTSHVAQFEISYESESIAFQGSNFLEAPAVPGRVYRVRLTRGREVTYDGVLTDPSDTALRLYYFDDWSNGDGTGTNRWIEHPDSIVTAYAGDVYFEIRGESRHGFSYIKGWSEAGAFFGDLDEGPGHLVSSKIVNNIISSIITDAIKCGGDDIVYNNTINGVGGYGVNNKSTDNVINNVVNAGSGTSYNDNTNIDYCIGEDVSVGSSNNNIQYYMNFEDEPNDVLFPNFSDLEARGTGKPMLGDSEFPFNIDATGTIRGRLWDRGALEYIPENIICYSVGNTSLNIAETGESPSLGYSIVEDALQRSVITFSNPQTGDKFGIGNEVTDLDSGNLVNGCLLFEKIDNSNWVVKDYQGNNVPDVSASVVNTISRTFSSLNWATNGSVGVFSSSYLNSKNLTSIRTRVKIACYDDRDTNPDIFSFLVDDVISDPDYFLKIFTPSDTSTEVNSSQKHPGNYNSGYLLETEESLNPQYYGIKVSNVDYMEIDGLIINLQRTAGHYSIKNSIMVESSHGVLVSSNLIIGTGNGVRIVSESGSRQTDRDVIVNNIIYDLPGDGIPCGSGDALTNSKLFVYNNTIVNCRRGLYFIHPPSGDSVTCEAKNNIIQDSILQDYVEENPSYASVFNMYNNISKDSSSILYGGSGNLPNVEITFLDKDDKNFDLNISDVIAIDSGLNLSSDADYSFLTDVVGRIREEGAWDIGAFELIEINGEGEFAIGPIEVGGIPFATNTPPTFSLYLRENKSIGLPSVDLTYKFESITELNTFLSDNSSIYDGYNLIVYVEGGKSFEGSFEFNDKGSRTVKISTLLEESRDVGPGSIIYSGPVIDNASLMSKITFDSVKVYSEDGVFANTSLLSNSYPGTLEMEFINSIAQVNQNSITGYTDTTVKCYNSILIYKSASFECYLNPNSITGNLIVNSMILIVTKFATNFVTTNVVSDDFVINCLVYNYGSGTSNFGNSTTKVINSIVNQDPKFLEAEVEQGFVPSELMSNDFIPDISSLVVDAGENSYVEDIIPYDIIGNDRIFDFKIVDIGPYELEIHNFSFTSKNLLRVFQDKLSIDYDTKNCSSRSDDTVYRDLYYQFLNNPLYRKEFLRESKIIFKVSEDTSEYRTFTDKESILVNTFEAYYDNGSRSIIISKDSNLFDELFNNIFNEGKYIFYFNEVGHYLNVYLNDTHDKGLSGDRNVIKNVKFGGPSIASN